MIRRESSMNIDTEEEEEDEPDMSFSEMLYTKNQILRPSDFSLNSSAAVDFLNQVDTAVIFPKMSCFTVEELVEEMLMALLDSKNKGGYFQRYQQFEVMNKNKSATVAPEIELGNDVVMVATNEELLNTNTEFTVELAMKAIFVSETVSNICHCIQRTMFNDQDGIYYDDTWLIILCELQSIQHRKIVIARLAYDMYLMPTCHSAKCVILIIGNPEEKGMKNVLVNGANFGTVLSLPTFMEEFRRATTAKQIVHVFKDAVRELRTGETNIESLAHATAQVEKESFKLHTPLSGIRRDIARRLPYYFLDFSDGLTGYKTKQKLIAAIMFHYLATLLPIIALGDSVSQLTDNVLVMATVVYSQFFGSILYGIFTGNPMMMFQVSSIVLLYSKVLYAFAQSTHQDFHTTFCLTGMFSGIMIALCGIFNLGDLMVYSTSSVADMLDVFQSITFVEAVGSELYKGYTLYPDCEATGNVCRPQKFVLHLLTTMTTVVIATSFRSIRDMRSFNTAIREFLSDLSVPVAVTVASLMTSVMFSDINQVKLSTVLISAALSVPLAMLIFIDHNVNMEFLSDPRNKLYKGCAQHLDMLVIGIINALFSMMGMCSMQGASPNTPLHIYQMGDVEVNTSSEIATKTLIRVRDTRLTQLIVGTLIGMSTFLLPLPVGYIPKAALSGVLLQIAIISLEGNGLVDRLRLFYTDQIAQVTAISAISFNSVSVIPILFPVMLVLLIPFRLFLIPKMFDHNHLELIDPAKVETGQKRNKVETNKPKVEATQ